MDLTFEKLSMFKKLCIATILFITLTSTAYASWGISWHYSPYGWSSSMTVSNGSSWLYRPFWSSWTYTPYYLYTPAYYTLVLPAPSEAQRKYDFNRCLDLLRTKELIYNTQKELARKQEEETTKSETKDIQIDIDPTPLEETPTIETSPTIIPTQKDDTETPQPKGTIILAEGSVIIKTY